MDEYKNKGMINNLKPKTAFKAGLLTGLAIVFVLGFFVLLGVLLNDKIDFNSGNNNGGNVVNNGDGGDNSGIQIQAVGKDDWIKGNDKAKVSIIEFSDIDCPFCQRHHDTMNQLMLEYGDRINWTFRHLPLTRLHPDAFKKAEATECVGELGGNDKFWEFLDKLFATKPSLAQLGDTAASIGIDKNKFQDCLDSGKYTNKVSDDMKQAQAAGGEGTPYSVIVSGNTKIPIKGALPYDTIKAQLDSVLN